MAASTDFELGFVSEYEALQMVAGVVAHDHTTAIQRLILCMTVSIKDREMSQKMFQNACMNKIMELARGGEYVTAKDGKGCTALHLAPMCPVDLTDILVAAGAKLNARDNHGRTPLHAAAKLGSLDHVAKLMSLGTNPNRRCDRGLRPIDDAELPDHFKRFLSTAMYEFNHCRVCDTYNIKLRKCAGCLKARYCSIECRRLDWPEHVGHC